MDAEDLRLAVYRTFAETGRAPDAGELAAQLGAGAREVARGLAELARGRHLALGDRGQITSSWILPTSGQSPRQSRQPRGSGPRRPD